MRAIDRRDFLKASGAAFLSLLGPAASAALGDTDEVLASCCRKPDGGFALALFTGNGGLLRLTDLPGRGHDVVQHPASRRVVVFARRPGTFAVAIDTDGRTPPVVIAAAAGRHFYGHGAFSADGRLLYATENDFDGARGVVGVYDATDGFARLGEFDSGGIGPHELLLMDDGRTLAIANGGLETHPDFGRTVLNATTMKPSLALVDTRTGDLAARHEPPPEQYRLSIRHMALDGDGTIWFGCQNQAGELDLCQPVGMLRRDRPLAFLEFPEKIARSLRGYIGSVAAAREDGRVAVASPKGHVAVIFDGGSGEVLRTRRENGVCGLAASEGRMIATSGPGVVVPLEPDGKPAKSTVAWDNHVIALA